MKRTLAVFHGKTKEREALLDGTSTNTYRATSITPSSGGKASGSLELLLSFVDRSSSDEALFLNHSLPNHVIHQIVSYLDTRTSLTVTHMLSKQQHPTTAMHRLGSRMQSAMKALSQSLRPAIFVHPVPGTYHNNTEHGTFYSFTLLY